MRNLEFQGSFLEAERTGNKYPIKVIQPGWGSSGYYPEETLMAAAPLFDGAQMFWNHPKESDNYERPERDLRDLAGVITNVRYEGSNPEGAGIYGDATVFEPFRETLNEIAPHIGVSIRAGGTGHEGEAEGRGGLLIDEINAVHSVDFVTRAGAGGKIISQFMEAARQEKGDSMELEEAQKTIAERDATIAERDTKISELEAELTEAKADAARLNEALLVSQCATLVSTQLNETELPQITKDRIAEDSARFVKTCEREGKTVLDTEAVTAEVAEAVKSETEYISQLSEGVKVEGMGAAPAPAEEDVDMTAMFEAMGMSESAAQIAAQGR